MMEITFYRGQRPFVPPVHIDSIALSNQTFVSGVDAVVGLVSVYMAGPLFSGSLSVGGADAASFKIVGSNLVTNGTIAAGTYSITLIATQATANNSPFTSDSFTITGTPGQSFVSLGLDTTSFVPNGISAVTVGNVVAVLTPASPASTATIVLGGTNAGSFQLTNGGVLPCAVQAKATTGTGSFTIALTATQTGISGSPFPSGNIGITGNASAAQIFTRTVNADSASAVPASAFTMFGCPLKKADVPTGSIVTLKNGATTLRSSAISFHYEFDSSLSWCLMLADLSTASIGGGSIGAGTTFALNGNSGSGTWSTSNSRTTTDFINLVDTVEITSLTTTGTSANDMDKAGTWVAALDGAATVKTIGICGLGTLYEVTANFTNTGTTHRFLRAIMYYLVFEKADLTLGPIASLGPFIDNTRAFKTQPSQFNYNLNWKRNAVSQRSHTAVQNFGMSFASLRRLDGRWDWSANDPKIWISQDYAQTGRTLKMPRFQDSISYVPAFGNQNLLSNPISSIDASGFFSPTSGSTGSLGNGNSTVPVTALQFTATSFPSGAQIAASTVYWAAFGGGGGTSFRIYDTLAHAKTNDGTTGIIKPTGAFTALAAQICCAPSSVGILNQNLPGTGQTETAQIGAISEWEAAYHVGNTKATQDFNRIQADCFSGVPVWLVDDTTNTIPSLLRTGLTPSGMLHSGAGLPNDQWDGSTEYSSDINGGAGPTGAKNDWTWEGKGNWHWPNSGLFGVWLMEGDPFFQKLLMQNANRAMAFIDPSKRNMAFQSVTYSGMCGLANNADNTRSDAWSWRDLVNGWFAAEEDAAPSSLGEKTYFKNAITQNSNFMAAYATWADGGSTGNYHNLGFWWTRPGGVPFDTASLNFAQGDIFHQFYMATALARAAQLVGDFVAGVNTAADQIARGMVLLYNPIDSWCPYFTTATIQNWGITDRGAAGPGVCVGTLADIAFYKDGSVQVCSFSNGSSTISWSGGDAPFTPVVGDRVRFNNWDESANDANAAPSGFTDGTNYFIKTISVASGSGTMTVSAISGGSAVVAGAAQSGVGVSWIPTAQSCPSGAFGNTNADPDGYIAIVMAANAVNAIRGYQTAEGKTPAVARTNAIARLDPGNYPTFFNNRARWAWQGSL